MRSLTPVLLVALLAAGCQASPQDPADAAKRAECRARMDEVYRARNRASMLLGTDQRSTPFAANYDVGNTSRGLGQLYGQDRAEAECLHALVLQPEFTRAWHRAQPSVPVGAAGALLMSAAPG